MSAEPARRELAAVLVGCAAGGGLALLAGSQGWLALGAARPRPLPAVALQLSGRELEPLVPALGVLGLAGVLGLLATRRSGRVAVGAVLGVAGIVVVARALTHLGTPSVGEVRELLADSGRAGGVQPDAAVSADPRPWWPLVAALGGVLLAAGGLGVVLRSRRWPTMSARYERRGPRRADPARAAATPRPASDAALWDALDRGQDPTAAPDGTAGPDEIAAPDETGAPGGTAEPGRVGRRGPYTPRTPR